MNRKKNSKVKDTAIKLHFMDRDRDNLDGEQVRQIHPDMKGTSDVEIQDDDVDKEENGTIQHHHYNHQHHERSPRAPPPRVPYGIDDIESSGQRRHSRREENEESSVDREEEEYYQRDSSQFLQPQPRRRTRRSSIRSAEQFARRSWLRDCEERLRNFFPSPVDYFSFTKEDFRQQQLPIVSRSWWDCKSVGKLLLVFSMLTLILGVVLFVTSTHAREYRFHFGEECKYSRNYLRLIRSMCVFCGGNLNPHCSKVIHIPEDIRLPVYVYYELEGFYQNHRMLTRAMDNDQLLGNIFTGNMKPVKPENCGNYSTDSSGKIYFPCGLLANLMYNDDFTLFAPSGEEVLFRTHGIAWGALKHYRFRNPPPEIVTPKDYHLRVAFIDNFVKPKDWTTEMWDNWWRLGGNENERFINWMNPSAFPTMRKLYAVIDSVPTCPLGLFCKGNYTLNIEYRYDVDRFEGDKAVILAASTFFGGQNLVFASLVGVIGCLELTLGLILVQLHRKFGSKLHDMVDLEEDTDDVDHKEDDYEDNYNDSDLDEELDNLFPVCKHKTPVNCRYRKPPPPPPNSPAGKFLASRIQIQQESEHYVDQPSYKPSTSAEGMRRQDEEMMFFYEHDQDSFLQESQYAFPNLVNVGNTAALSEIDFITEEENDDDSFGDDVSDPESYLSYGSDVMVTAAGSSSESSSSYYLSESSPSPTESLNVELEEEEGSIDGYISKRRYKL